MDYRRIFSLLGICLSLLAVSCQKDYQLELDFALNRENLRFTKSAGRSYFLVYSKGTWTVSLPEGTDWVTLGRTEGEGNRQVSVFCSANRHTSRGVYATITNHDGATKQVYISQEAAIESPYYTFARQATGLHAGASSFRIAGDTNLDAQTLAGVEISIDGDWIHDAALTEGNVTFRVDAYNATGGGPSREGTITLAFPAAEWDQNRCVAVLNVRQSPEAPKLQLEESYTLDAEGAKPTLIAIKGNFEPRLYPDLDYSSYSLGTSGWMNSVSFDSEALALVLIPQRNAGVPKQARSTSLTCYLKSASGQVMDQCETILRQEAADENYDYSTAVRIGTEGTGANAWMVEHALGGKFYFDTRYTDGTAIDGIASVRVIWQTEDKMLQYPLCQNGKLYLTLTAGKIGNALLAVCDASNKVLWTFHVWVAGEAVQSRTLGGKVFMDRNLGALSALAPTGSENASAGLYYQWGRPVPFPGTDAFSPTGNRNHKAVYPDAVKIEKAQDGKDALWVTQHPGYYVMGTSGGSGSEDWCDTQDPDRWGGVSGTKSRFDPCPVGWKVPLKDDFTADFLDRLKAPSFASFGVLMADDDGKDTFFPASGTWRRTFSDASEMANVGTRGWFWTSSCGAFNTNYYGGYRLIVQSSTTRNLSVEAIRWGASVRCIKESSSL